MRVSQEATHQEATLPTESRMRKTLIITVFLRKVIIAKRLSRDPTNTYWVTEQRETENSERKVFSAVNQRVKGSTVSS